jgi:hypothetical protein
MHSFPLHACYMPYTFYLPCDMEHWELKFMHEDILNHLRRHIYPKVWGLERYFPTRLMWSGATDHKTPCPLHIH